MNLVQFLFTPGLNNLTQLNCLKLKIKECQSKNKRIKELEIENNILKQVALIIRRK